MVICVSLPKFVMFDSSPGRSGEELLCRCLLSGATAIFRLTMLVWCAKTESENRVRSRTASNRNFLITSTIFSFSCWISKSPSDGSEAPSELHIKNWRKITNESRTHSELSFESFAYDPHDPDVFETGSCWAQAPKCVPGDEQESGSCTGLCRVLRQLHRIFSPARWVPNF